MREAKVSYHAGHSGDFCDHARDTKQLLVEAYLQKAFTHVGIVEHIPPHNDNFLYDEEIKNGHNALFLMERFDDYLTHARKQIQKTFDNQLHLLFGFETEFYGQKPLERITELVNKYQPDFIVASVHHVHDIPIDYSHDQYQKAAEKAGGIEALYINYYDHQFDLVQHLSSYVDSGMPVIIGHFDLIKLLSFSYNPTKAVREKMLRNIKKAIECGCVFEVNARAFKKGLGEPYPGVEILKDIARLGGKVTLGDDSHAVSEIGLFYEKILPIVKTFFNEITVFEKQGDTVNTLQLSL